MRKACRVFSTEIRLREKRLADAIGCMTVQSDIDQDIRREEGIGLIYIFWARITALCLLGLWVILTTPLARSAIYLIAIGCFGMLGAIPYIAARRSRVSTQFAAAFLLLDAAFLTYVLIMPPNFYVEGWTPQLNLRLPNFLYIGIFLVGMALSYSPGLVIWAGAASILAWSVGFIWVARLPETLLTSSRTALDSGLRPDEVIDSFLDPRTVSVTTWEIQLVFLLLVTMILTVTVWRSRRLVRRQAIAEFGRAALSRYFSPNIAQEIASNPQALDRSTVQPAAILFADMVGFTSLSESLPPIELIALLRDFHGRLARIVFEHQGTVDKYIGDAIMAHFGTPNPQRDDAAKALSCAAAMLAEIKRWSAERASVGDAPIRIGIGVHYGEVVVGNIGDERRLEYTVLGDAVNVASRLERLTRRTASELMVSDELIRAVSRCGVDPSAVVHRLHLDHSRFVRGRHQPLAIWRVPATPEPIGAVAQAEKGKDA